MSIVKTRGPPRSDRPAEIEGTFRALVRRDSGTIRQSEDISEQATADLSSLVAQVSGESERKIDHLIDGLRYLRQKLDDNGRRVRREIVEYPSLSRSVIQLTKIVSEGMTHGKKCRMLRRSAARGLIQLTRASTRQFRSNRFA
jgi:hypothetical protein